MTTTVEAVYKNGSIHFLEPMELAEGDRIKIVKETEGLSLLPQGPDPQRAAEILAEIAAMPMEPGGEEFSGQDHDRILYGEKGAR